MRTALFALGFIISVLTTPTAYGKNPSTLKSSEKQAHLVELFSTQSCSSCPSAQEWISSLKSREGLWKTFVPVVLHVDYWDYLGWKDPYSKKEFTERQRTYSSTWKSDSMYTPMFVLDGKEWRSRSISQISKTGSTVGILSVSRLSENTFELNFESQNLTEEEIQFLGAAIKNDVTTSVKSGENRGKKLSHDFLAVEFNKTSAKGKNHGKKTLYAASLTLGPKAKETNEFVFWVANPSDLKAIQAVGGTLKVSQKGAIN